MSQRPIIDAGPSLNFLSINKERLPIGVLGPLSVPETEEVEVLRNSREDARFRSAATIPSGGSWHRAAGGQHIPDKAAMRDVYKRLRGPDDGLPPVETTNLLSIGSAVARRLLSAGWQVTVTGRNPRRMLLAWQPPGFSSC